MLFSSFLPFLLYGQMQSKYGKKFCCCLIFAGKAHNIFLSTKFYFQSYYDCLWAKAVILCSIIFSRFNASFAFLFRKLYLETQFKYCLQPRHCLIQRLHAACYIFKYALFHQAERYKREIFWKMKAFCVFHVNRQGSDVEPSRLSKVSLWYKKRKVQNESTYIQLYNITDFVVTYCILGNSACA